MKVSPKKLAFSVIKKIFPFTHIFFSNFQQTVESWRMVFTISSIFLLVSGFIFMLFGTSEEQSWNNSKSSDDLTIKTDEMQNLREKSETNDKIHEKVQLTKINEQRT